MRFSAVLLQLFIALFTLIRGIPIAVAPKLQFIAYFRMNFTADSLTFNITDLKQIPPRSDDPALLEIIFYWEPHRYGSWQAGTEQ